MSGLETIAIGDLVLVALPVHNPPRREQQGIRPAVVVGVPSGEIRYPTIAIAPLTTTTGSWSSNNPILYPLLEAGTGDFNAPQHG